MAILRSDTGEIIRDEAGAVLRVPTFSTSYPQILTYVIPSTGERPKLKDIDLALFSDAGSIIQEPIRVIFPEEVGFVAFALPLDVTKRLSWFVTGEPLNAGLIGGEWSPNNINLWPRGELKIYNDIGFLVYWSSYVTKFKTTQRVNLSA
jgi:hypothetical protein